MTQLYEGTDGPNFADAILTTTELVDTLRQNRVAA